MKFYPRDWRGDQALRAVSVSARGLWIDCLCIMHEAKPYGHLVLNGSSIDGDTLARMTGVPVDVVSALMAELRQAGVLSVTGKGVVFSRRMTKDFDRAQKGKKAANKRWSEAAENKEQNAPPNGLPNGDPITQKPEARSQIEPKPLAQQSTAALRDEVLDKLLEAAGVKGNPPTGLAFHGPILGLIDGGYSLEADILPAIRAKPNPRARSWTYFVPQIRDAADQRRKIASERRPDPLGQLASWPLEKWRMVLENSRQQHEWQRQTYGPPPFTPGCLVPLELLTDQDREIAA